MARRDKGQAPAPPPTPGKKDLSILAAYDELIRNNKVLLDSSEEQFLQFSVNQDLCRRRWQAAELECQRLQDELGKSGQEIRSLELRLGQARDLLGAETGHRKRAEQERDVLEQKWMLVRELILTDGSGNHLNDETRQKLRLLESSVPTRRGTGIFSPGGAANLSVVNEIDSTGSILDASDLSFDQTCDPTADESRLRSGRTYKRKSSGGLGATRRKSKKSRSIGDRLSGGGEKSKNRVSAPKKSLEAAATRKSSGRPEFNERNIDAFIPSAPPAEDDATRCWVEAQALTPMQTTHQQDNSPSYTPAAGVRRTYSNAGKSRKHVFVQKTVLKPETCGPCGRRIKFGKVCLKCRDCKATSHQECKEQVPLPCVAAAAAGRTPTRNQGGTIADFTPLMAPMVPALIVHCVNEVDERGLGEVGIYRVPGSEKDVKDLKERYLKGKGPPNLRKCDIHVICGCIKDFLRSLREPLIPHSMWSMFTQAAINPDPSEGESSLYQAISELPQPNRDTLAFLMLHLQRVSECPDSKMPRSNLAKILGPTIVGYSCPEPNPTAILAETGYQAITMEKLMSIDSDYWGTFVNFDDDSVTPSRRIFSPTTPETIFRPLAPGTGLTPTPQSHRIETRLRANTGKFSSARQKNIFASPMLK